MKVVIFGAAGQTGQLLTEQALTAGLDVTAVTRRAGDFGISHPNLRIARVDVSDPAAASQAIAGQDAVLSALGVPYGLKKISLYSTGIANIIHGMQQHGVRRLMAITSSAVESHPNPEAGFLMEKVMQPIITRTIGKTTYDDMRRMEKLMRASDLDWTIIRPGGLFETPTVTDYRTAETHVGATYASRADLAASMLEQVTKDTYVRKVMAVGTYATQPKMSDFLFKEATGK